MNNLLSQGFRPNSEKKLEFKRFGSVSKAVFDLKVSQPKDHCC